MKVKGMQQELVQVRLLQQNCVRLWKVAVEAEDTAMLESAHPVVSGREERPVLEQSPRTPKAPRKELHPPFSLDKLELKKHFLMKMRFWSGLTKKKIIILK